MRNNSILEFIKGWDGGYKHSIEIVGNEIAIVENVTSLIEYSEHTIRLLAGKKHVVINGNNLQLNGYREKSVYVKGNINGIFFE